MIPIPQKLIFTQDDWIPVGMILIPLFLNLISIPVFASGGAILILPMSFFWFWRSHFDYGLLYFDSAGFQFDYAEYDFDHCHFNFESARDDFDSG